MLLLALLNVPSWIVFVTHPLSLKYPTAYSINLFNLTLLVYWWTAPSATWKSRNTRKSFVVMALLSAIVIYRMKMTVFQIICHAVKRLERIGSLT